LGGDGDLNRGYNGQKYIESQFGAKLNNSRGVGKLGKVTSKIGDGSERKMLVCVGVKKNLEHGRKSRDGGSKKKNWELTQKKRHDRGVPWGVLSGRSVKKGRSRSVQTAGERLGRGKRTQEITTSPFLSGKFTPTMAGRYRDGGVQNCLGNYCGDPTGLPEMQVTCTTRSLNNVKRRERSGL